MAHACPICQNKHPTLKAGFARHTSNPSLVTSSLTILGLLSTNSLVDTSEHISVAAHRTKDSCL